MCAWSHINRHKVSIIVYWLQLLPDIFLSWVGFSISYGCRLSSSLASLPLELSARYVYISMLAAICLKCTSSTKFELPTNNTFRSKSGSNFFDHRQAVYRVSYFHRRWRSKNILLAWKKYNWNYCTAMVRVCNRHILPPQPNA